jgi:membrane protein
MLAYLRVPIGWVEILKRTFTSTNKDDVLAFAGTLAYSFFFALFPALIFLVALASFFPLHGLIDQLMSRAGTMAPPQMMQLIADQLKKLSNSNNGGLLTFGIVLTIFSASGGMTAVIDALNHAYDIQEGRSWWKVRVTAVGLVVMLGIFTLVSLALIMVGPALAGRLANAVGLGPEFAIAWKIVEWPIAFVLVALGIGIVYWKAPDAEQDWVWITPGSLVATLLWVIASFGFRVYLEHFDSYNKTYGALGGIMIMLLWLYITGLVLLVGAEMNAEIEHASPYGKNPGEKRPGERRKIGIAARRAYEEAQRQAGMIASRPTSPAGAAAAGGGNCEVDRPTVEHPREPVAAPAPAYAMARARGSGGRVGVSRMVLAGVVVAEFALAVWTKIRRTKASA